MTLAVREFCSLAAALDEVQPLQDRADATRIIVSALLQALPAVEQREALNFLLWRYRGSLQ
jgi:hypothetical protein